MPDDTRSVTEWMRDIQDGVNEDEALERLWDRYFELLTRRACEALRGCPTAAVGGEDVALSTLDCIHRGLKEGRLGSFEGRDNLARLMFTIVVRKVGNVIRKENAQRNGAGRVISEHALGGTDDGSGGFGLDRLPGHEPAPEDVGMFAAELRSLMEALPAEGLYRRVAASRLEGFSYGEIADQLGCSVSSVERKVGVIRGNWGRMLKGLDDSQG